MIDKESLISACDTLFDTELGKSVILSVNKAINENGMLTQIKNGVVIGLSGGADSVLLLIILRKLQKELNFPLKALHVNHMIRKGSADLDEDFSKKLCEALNVDFQSLRKDVPAYAAEKRIGTEEAARIVRYDFFESVIKSDERFSTVATAHNSTDNLETLIFNFMRGSGTRGLSGIAPVRNNVVRPLIYVSKQDVTTLLNDAEIPFVTDETNFSLEYTRNYIRHEILPKLQHLTPNPEQMASKAASNLRSDSEYLESVAEDFYLNEAKNGKINSEKMKKLHQAIRSRVIRIMCKKFGAPTPEKIHLDKISELLGKEKDFEVDIPGDAKFLLKEQSCFIECKKICDKAREFNYTLTDGFNELHELNIAIAVTDDKNEDFSSNVYKISIQANANSAIIFGRLSVRNKRDGDSYYYGGMTRKVKKLFSDKKVPKSIRERIPIIADEKGIVWVPGFGVRDDSPKNKKNKWITIYEKVV